MKPKPSMIASLTCALLLLAGCPSPPKPSYRFNENAASIKGVNTPFDEVNMAEPPSLAHTTVFSSNQTTEGKHFDFVRYLFRADWDRNVDDADLFLAGERLDDLDPRRLPLRSFEDLNTDANEIGPAWVTLDPPHNDKVMLLYASDAGGDFDIYSMQEGWEAPKPATLLNSEKNDAYPTVDETGDSIYFCSDRGGVYDIYVVEPTQRFDLSGEGGELRKVEALSSPGDDKCPSITGSRMVFSSNRPGGQGGFDLWSSDWRDGRWSPPRNLGPKVNSKYDEQRPVFIETPQFRNDLLLFSSNRPGGEGGFDLYYAGIDRGSGKQPH